MAKVLCTRPNASEEISGVKFKQVENGMLSEDISDEQAAVFVAVGGYELVAGGEEKPKETEKQRKAREKAEAAEAEAKADAEAAEAEAAAGGDDKK